MARITLQLHFISIQFASMESLYRLRFMFCVVCNYIMNLWSCLNVKVLYQNNLARQRNKSLLENIFIQRYEVCLSLKLIRIKFGSLPGIISTIIDSNKGFLYR